MRHNKSFNHLGRKKAHRVAMLGNMASSLIRHKRITTTLAKAKALRSYIEPLITKAKEDSTHSRRVVFSNLQDKDAVTELFRDVAQKVADRPGGYTRILKTGTRLGDNAEMCMIELVDYNELMLGTKEVKKTGSRRRRGTGAGKKEVEATTETKTKTGKKAGAAKEETVEETEDIQTTEDVVEEPVDEVQETTAETEEPAAPGSDETAEAKPEEEPGDEPKA
jgi:large subunit ribosomal protein L17